MEDISSGQSFQLPRGLNWCVYIEVSICSYPVLKMVLRCEVIGPIINPCRTCAGMVNYTTQSVCLLGLGYVCNIYTIVHNLQQCLDSLSTAGIDIAKLIPSHRTNYELNH